MSDPIPMTRAAIPAFVNPKAGGAAGVTKALSEAGGFAVHEIDPAKLQGEVRRAVEGGATRVLVAGGDGTIGSAAAVVTGTNVELAIVPAGTLNHFARFVHVPLAEAEAAAVATGDSIRLVDVGYVNDRLILNTSSVGAYVLFVHLREHLERRLGYRLASCIAAIRILLSLHTFRVTLDVGGERRSYDTPLVFLGIGERELKLPGSGDRIEGGQRGLHVIVVRRKWHARRLLAGLALLARGVQRPGDTRRAGIESFVVDSCVIEMSRPRGNVAIDGEILPMIAPLEYRIACDALRVVAPPEAPPPEAPA